MQSFHVSFSPFLFLSLLLLSSFHGQLGNGQVVNFPTGEFDKKSLYSLEKADVDASGTLTLNSSAGDAQAFFINPISLTSGTASPPTVQSFTSFFTFASNATSGNGTIAFVFTPDVAAANPVSLTEARKTLTIEFNASCNGGNYYNGGATFQGRRGGFRGRGFGGYGGFQVIEYANTSSIGAQIVSGYGPNWNGPEAAPYFCAQSDPTNPTFQYQVVVEYNASTDTVWVGSPSCGNLVARTTEFYAQDLTGIITKPVYVGFLVSGGGIFSITQWNFSNNVNASSLSSLALSSVVTSTSGSSSDGSMDGGRGHSDGKLKKGYVIAFSVLGAAIGVAAVLLVCCLCMRRKRVTSARFVAKSVHSGTIPESAVVFDAKKPHAPPAKVVYVDRDTTPLNTHASSTTGTASWLQPVAPR